MGGRWDGPSKREQKRRMRAALHTQGLGPRDPARKKTIDEQEDLSYAIRITNNPEAVNLTIRHSETIDKLIAEYRPSMTLDIVHAWAADLVYALTEGAKDYVTPGDTAVADPLLVEAALLQVGIAAPSMREDEAFLTAGTGDLWEVRVCNSLDDIDHADFHVRAETPEEAEKKAETVARRNSDIYFGGAAEPTYHAERGYTHVIEDEGEPDLDDDADRFYGPEDC